MSLSLVDENGVRVMEAQPDAPLLQRAADVALIVEACLSNRARLALVYAANLTASFFDLSSGEAGEVLQKLRNYGVQLAVVCAPGSVRMSSRFGEVVAEERRGPWFNVLETRAAAREWLQQVERS